MIEITFKERDFGFTYVRSISNPRSMIVNEIKSDVLSERFGLVPCSKIIQIGNESVSHWDYGLTEQKLRGCILPVTIYFRK